MTDNKRILLTGHTGYIGSVMAPILLAAGHEVVGYDTGYFNECTLVPDKANIPEIRKDIRNAVAEDLSGFDAVIHLAALSNDPIGNIDEGWTTEINHEASIRLAELARDAGVGRFLFSSSCIMYGMSDGGVVDETSPLDPQTEYALSKVKSERALAEMATDSFSPVYIRNGTIYGVSPRMRFDTVLNNLVGAAYTSKEIKVLSDGKPWRPVIHVEDVCRSFLNMLTAPRQDIHNEAFNNGADHLNHQVIELAQMAADVVPGCTLEVLNEPSADQRTYKASFAKFARTFPDFEWKWTARTGAQDLADTFQKVGLTADEYSGMHFTRLKWLNHLLDENKLDRDLRWT